MRAHTQQAPLTQALAQAPSTLEHWFPIAVWSPKYNWGKYL